MTTNTTNPATSRLDGSTPNVETVRALIAEHNNWGRWGADDQVGTLNHVAPLDLVRAAGTIQSGKRFSLALPFDSDGPQRGGFGRFNPIHLMFRDGGDIVAGTIVDDFYGGNDRYCRGTDDLVIMPLQSGTQWDALSHIIFDGTMYNGYSPTNVTSKGASRNDIAQAADRIAGRGVLPTSTPWAEAQAFRSSAVIAYPGSSASTPFARARSSKTPRQLGGLRRRARSGDGSRQRPVDRRTRDRGSGHRHLGHGSPAERDA
jgi:hypothetical protein